MGYSCPGNSFHARQKKSGHPVFAKQTDTHTHTVSHRGTGAKLAAKYIKKVHENI